MADLLDFSGKVALVTGSSRGLGAEMIKALIGDSDRQKYLADNAKKLLVALHTDEKRAEQLFKALHLIHSGKITSAKFKKGEFVYE